jgi:predicted phosphohydrolase
MKLVVISDTHNQHRFIQVPMGDVLIHCGDFTSIGRMDEVTSFLQWFDKKPHKYKIFIAGNHEKSFDPKFSSDGQKPQWLQEAIKSATNPRNNVFYLEESGVEIEGVKFWGSPWTKDFYPQYWAFNCPQDEIVERHWSKIPTDTDVLITHGPGLWLDTNRFNKSCGDPELQKIVDDIKPKYHLFGHIHKEKRELRKGSNPYTTFINASNLDDDYQIANQPITMKYNGIDRTIFV